jgi:hypothetical protein
VAEHGEVLGAVAFAESALIFAKGDIERPVQAVLNPPVVAHGPSKGLGVSFQAGYIEQVAELSRKI